MGLAACSWILGIENFSAGTDRDASFVRSSIDSYAPLDSHERETQAITPSTTNSDADLGDDAGANVVASEPPLDAGGADAALAAPDAVAEPDAPPDVSSDNRCGRLLRCCADLVLNRQLAAACVVASIADAGELCSAGLGLLAEAGICR